MTTRLYSHAQWRRVVVTTLCTAATCALAGVLATPAFAKSCHSTGHKIYNAHGVVVFTHSDHGKYPVFICASPSGNVKELSNLSDNASVTRVKRAGHYVGFFLNLNLEGYVQSLAVYNRDHGRIELQDLSQCGLEDDCTGPDMAGFALASNGWVAENWEDLASPGDALLATDGGPRHYQLEFGGVSNLSVAGNTAHWDSPSGGKSSAVLGSGVVPNPNYNSSLTACQLLIADDVQSLVGSAAGVAGSGDCTYTGADGTLEVSLATGLTPTAVETQMNNLEDDGDNNPPYNPPGLQWPGNLDISDFGNESGGLPGPQTDGFVGFYRGVEIQIQYTSGNDQEATVSHLTTVALERLLRVDVKRAH
jgi:hypothetical protein